MNMTMIELPMVRCASCDTDLADQKKHALAIKELVMLPVCSRCFHRIEQRHHLPTLVCALRGAIRWLMMDNFRLRVKAGEE